MSEFRNRTVPCHCNEGRTYRPIRWVGETYGEPLEDLTDQAEAIRARDDTAAARGLAYALGLSLPVWVAVFAILYFAWQFAGRPGL